MFLALTKKNCRRATINDDGWPFVEALGQRWERTDPGVWRNNDTGEFAFRQKNGKWNIDGAEYDNIKLLMLDEVARLTTA